MVHLRLIVAPEQVGTVVDGLRATAGVAHVVHLAALSCSPPGDVVLCDVAREAANDVIEWLQAQGVHHVAPSRSRRWRRWSRMPRLWPRRRRRGRAATH